MRLDTRTWLPVPRDRVFAFFAAAENLQVLTPDWLRFQILTPLPIAMRAGTLIDYRIRLHGIPLTWRTAIETWEPPHRFVDAQVRGPYSRWVHTHTFVEDAGGTLVGDDVDFAVIGGAPAYWFVARDLRRIFAYRHVALRRIFALPPAPVPEIRVTRA